MQVTVSEASQRLSQLIRSVQAGEAIVIADRGEPVARLVPVGAGSARGEKVGRASTILAWLASHPAPPGACRSAEEIDAAIAAERDAWE